MAILEPTGKISEENNTKKIAWFDGNQQVATWTWICPIERGTWIDVWKHENGISDADTIQSKESAKSWSQSKVYSIQATQSAESLTQSKSSWTDKRNWSEIYQ